MPKSPAQEHPENDSDGKDRPASGAAEVTRLRDHIDRGGTGDKVAFQDPAAAPLGTDDEAAGHPPTAQEAARARRAEAHRAPLSEAKPGPGDRQAPPARRSMLALALLVALGLAALLFIFF